MTTRSVSSTAAAAARQRDREAACGAADAAMRISSPLVATALVLSRALSGAGAMCLLTPPPERGRGQ